MVSFQGEADGYTRTLEEAMLSKLFGIKIEDTFTIAEWEKKKEDSGIKFKIPSEKRTTKVQAEETEQIEVTKENESPKETTEMGEKRVGVRQIIEKTSNDKTDFMYSVILAEKEKEMLPHYIEEGLTWLME